ncbi:unnamed protein product [Caenorhabditis angaria]|uniref:Mannosyltransferase n=1 Tax=Caenorhabditis angaria TaxID=860376 RepID=A0A9P1N4D8_9PELO|nr:unnamed protein product [Caenorhabditis angaria]
MVPKVWQLILIRSTLGFMNILAFLSFARSIQRIFGSITAFYLRIIIATQFHYIFYISRPLPNTFALLFVMIVFERILENRLESAVRWATASVFLFRCELVLLYGPLFLPYFLNGRLPFFGHDGAIPNGIRVSSLCLALTLPIDSYFWQRPVWPEGEVAYFNIIQNKSHEYGVSPFLWYFYSALPRALLSSIFLVPLGLLLDRRLYSLVFPAFFFVLLYSFLPHKELRFIIYVFPLFNLATAIFCARMYINRTKNVIRWFLYFGCLCHLFANLVVAGTLLLVSSRNYPGADAINHLHFQLRSDFHKPVNVYIDNACAQTGVSRFTEASPFWIYNKTENLKPDDLKDFDILVIGTYGSNLKEEVNDKFSKHHKLLYFVSAFHTYNIEYLGKFPWIYPTITYSEKAAVLVNRNYKH